MCAGYSLVEPMTKMSTGAVALVGWC
jgi:hypothetical protein